MDSQQPGIKRAIQVMSIQNQDDKMSSESKEGGDVKRFKQELHPLQMGAVLEQIFSNLDPDSVKAARQVNPLWSVEGAKMLITKCFVKIPSDIHGGDFVNRLKALEDFKAFLSHKSSSFSTIPNITVNGDDDVKLWKYLGVLGQQVKSLKINKSPSETKNEFFSNLLDLLPNLEYLSLKELGYEPKIIKVLASVMSASESDRQLLVVPFLHLFPDNVEQLKDIEEFALCKKIMIEELTVEMHPDYLDSEECVVRVAKAMSDLLSTSQNILKKLNLEDCHLILPLLEFPCMTALTHIEVEFEFEIADLSNCKFSPSFRFSEKVPNLQYVKISEPISEDPFVYGHIIRHCSTSLFESAGTAPFVDHVVCYGNVSNFDVYHLFKTFPNIEDLNIDVNWQSREMLRSLWKHGRNLKELLLDFDFDSPLDKVDDLDASFTGLPGWTVDEIKKVPNLDTFTSKEMKELKVELSILNLKELEQLTLRFRGSWEKDMPKRMLAVAGKYVFNRLPNNPEITINTIDFKDSMDLIDVAKVPNVEIVS